jgi:hypothetical protein
MLDVLIRDGAAILVEYMITTVTKAHKMRVTSVPLVVDILDIVGLESLATK